MKKDILIWGLYIDKIDFSDPFAFLIGNATSAWGMSDYLAQTGYSVGLVVSDICELINLDKKHPNITLIKREDAVSQCQNFERILFSTTCPNVLLEQYPHIKNINHEKMFLRTCFFKKFNEDVTGFLTKIKGVCCNNQLQLKNFKALFESIPAIAAPYGVMHNNPSLGLIQTPYRDNAVWIGYIRLPLQLQKIITFAQTNPECEIKIICRNLFDSGLPADSFGGANKPYINQTDETIHHDAFKDVVKLWCHIDVPQNVNYLGACWGKDSEILAKATMSLSFSRRLSQLHDDTKVSQYLSMGVPVISDDGQPSFRFVNEMKFGTIIPFNKINEKTLRNAYLKCRKLGSNANKKYKVAKEFSKKYDWFALSKAVLALMEKTTPTVITKDKSIKSMLQNMFNKSVCKL